MTGDSLAIPLDLELSRLRNVLSESYMQEFFNAYFHNDPATGRQRVSRCEIIKTYYRPGKRCVVTYALHFPRMARHRIASIQVARLGRSLRTQYPARSPLSTFLPDLHARLWHFPHDPKLTHLPDLTDPSHIQHLLPHFPNEHPIMDRAHRQVQIELLKYAPRKRCLVLVRIDDSAETGPTTLVAKVYRDTRGSRVFDTMQQLWVQQANSDKAFRVVQPLQYDDTRHVLWQRWSAGQSFIGFARHNGLTLACGQVARALAHLHQTGIRGLPLPSPNETVHELHEHAHLLMTLHGELEAPLSTLLERLDHSEALRRPGVEVAIHRDFNSAQILFDGDLPVVIDFDSASLGDPLYDVAHFVAGLHSSSLHQWFTPEEVMQAVRHFWRTYKDQVPWEVSEAALGAQVATALICRRAYKALRQLEQPTLPTISRYLGLATEYLKKGWTTL